MSASLFLASARPTRAVTGCILLAALSGCVGLGGNVKSSFACRAPDGICAPSAVIDDRALAMMSADPSSSAGPDTFTPAAGRSAAVRSVPTQPVRGPVAADAKRTGDRVMRIVFPAYIDEQGRLHEASAIHVVVAPGEWQAIAADTSIARNALAAAPQMEERTRAVSTDDRKSPAVDPHLPDPAAVAAARRRGADPVARIKADVEQRLLPSQRRGARQVLSASDGRSAALTSSGGKQAAGSTEGAAMSRASPDPAPKSQRSISSAHEPMGLPSTDTVRAGSFPAVVPGED